MSLIDCKNGLELSGIIGVIGIIGFHCLTEIIGADKLRGLLIFVQCNKFLVLHLILSELEGQWLDHTNGSSLVLQTPSKGQALFLEPRAKNKLCVGYDRIKIDVFWRMTDDGWRMTDDGSRSKDPTACLTVLAWMCEMLRSRKYSATNTLGQWFWETRTFHVSSVKSFVLTHLIVRVRWVNVNVRVVITSNPPTRTWRLARGLEDAYKTDRYFMQQI